MLVLLLLLLLLLVVMVMVVVATSDVLAEAGSLVSMSVVRRGTAVTTGYFKAR